MELFFDDKVQALTLLSITRTVLASGGGIFPLPGLEFERFMSATWSDLDCGEGVRVQAGIALARMFPPPGSTAGQIADEPALRGALASLSGPAETAGYIGARWRDCSGQSEAGRVMFMSSGSTGEPKVAAHSWAMLMQELDAIITFFPSLTRVITVTPLQHCYGFMFGVLAALFLGLHRLTLPPFPSMAREALASGDLVVGFPDFWRNMPNTGYSPPRNIFCLSATAPWPEAEQHALRASGYERSLEVFGSSENGVIGLRSHPGEPFELLPYWTRDPCETSALLRALPDGGNILAPIQDALHWEGERRFRLGGRLDHAVQVCGVNVYPSYVAERISGLPGVSACKVRLMRPEEGWRLKAFIVPSTGWSEERLSHSLKVFFREKLGAPERPVVITFGSSLPKTLYGKDSDW